MPGHTPAARRRWPSLHDVTITPWTQSQRLRDPARRLLFFLGTHRPWWLAHSPVPLCVSAHTLAAYVPGGPGLPIAGIPYVIDSGAYTEIRDHGTWRWNEDTYGGMVYRLMSDCGYPEFVAPLDFPCEPDVLARSGATVLDHQEWTLESYLYLAREFPHAPWMPVLQGWTPQDYERHDAMYRKAGVDLAAQRQIGLGSVCRRGSVKPIGVIAEHFARRGYRLHGFGLKTSALRAYAQHFVSADSLAWSQQARVTGLRLPGCRHAGHCNNCPAGPSAGAKTSSPRSEPRRTTPPPSAETRRTPAAAPRCAPRSVRHRTRGVQQKALDTPAPAAPDGERTTGAGRQPKRSGHGATFPAAPTHSRIHARAQPCPHHLDWGTR